MLVQVNVDDHVFEVIERSSQEYTVVTGDERLGEAMFIKLILTGHLLLHFQHVLSTKTFARLAHLQYDGRGLMEFFLAWDDARRGTAGYSMVMDAEGKIEAIDTPSGRKGAVTCGLQKQTF